MQSQALQTQRLKDTTKMRGCGVTATGNIEGGVGGKVGGGGSPNSRFVLLWALRLQSGKACVPRGLEGLKRGLFESQIYSGGPNQALARAPNKYNQGERTATVTIS